MMRNSGVSVPLCTVMRSYDAADVFDYVLVNSKFLHDLPCGWGAFDLLKVSCGRTVFAFGFMNANIMQDGGGLDRRRITAFDGLNLLCVRKHLERVLDAVLVIAKDSSHLCNNAVADSAEFAFGLR